MQFWNELITFPGFHTLHNIASSIQKYFLPAAHPGLRNSVFLPCQRCAVSLRKFTPCPVI
nr:MAG TPA_asm: hypothetical protein [Caudoviricetes sp.]